MSDAAPTLADAGFTPQATDPISGTHAHLVGACLDAPADRLAHGRLPALWHWAHFVPRARTADLGADGHPRRRAAMDAFPQRMWVGGRVRIARALEVDVEATRSSRIASAEPKEGGSGRFWLTTVVHEIAQHGETCVVEEQDLVFRGPSTLAPPGPERSDAPVAGWVEERVADPVLLFRFSAVTNNAHRIHYDRPYATDVEGYPDLVVHGPLTAILLADFALRHTNHRPTEITYRARAPHFANRRWWLAGEVDPDGTANVSAIRGDHVVAMTLQAR